MWLKDVFYRFILKIMDDAQLYRRDVLKKKLGLPDSVDFDQVVVIGNNLSIGERTYVGYGSVLSTGNKCHLRIGKDCAIGRYVHIASKTHDLSMPTSTEHEQMKEREAHTFIGNNVWIGDKVYIGPGITIGDHAIIGANSVVTANVSAFEIVGGVPARHIRFNTANINYKLSAGITHHI